MSTPAIFIDRDGTLVESRHYPSRPEDLVLYDGICDELRCLRARGFRLVLITNQSGIARGYFSEDDLHVMHEHLCDQMNKRGVAVDGIYYCPHHVDGVIEELAVDCDCRKPEPGMLLRAAEELDINLSRSWFVGDILDDVEAGNRAGCRTVLVDLGTESLPDRPVRWPDFVSRNAVHAMQIIQLVEGIDRCADVDYLPAAWQQSAHHDVEDWRGAIHADGD